MQRFIVLILVLFVSACAQQSPYYKDSSTQARPRPNPYNTPNYHPPQTRPKPVLPTPSRPALPPTNTPLPNLAPESYSEEKLSAPQTKLVDQAQNHLAHNENDQAASLLERAIRINPQAVKPYRLLAELRLKQGNKPAALELARKGLALIAKKGYPTAYSGEKARLEQLIARAQSARA